MKTAKVDIFAAALIRACAEWPYMADAMAAMTPVPTPGLGTCAVDTRWRVYFDPSTMERWSALERAAVVRHEVEHLLRDHAGRVGDRNHREWNRRCDEEINAPELARSLPKNGITPSGEGHPDGLLAEQYYDLARKEREEAAKQAPKGAPAQGQEGQPSDQDGGQGGGSIPSSGSTKPVGEGKSSGEQAGGEGPGSAAGDGSQAGDGSGGDDSRATAPPGGTCKSQPTASKVPEPKGDSAGGSAPGSAQASQPEDHGGCGGGSGVDGVPRPWELPASDPSGLGEVDRRLVRDAAARAIKASSSRGINVGSIGRWANAQLAPAKVDWHRELATIMRGELRAAGASDYSYGRPSRRHAGCQVVMPALRSRRPQIAIVVDTSGSMGDEQITEARSEVRGIAQAVGGEAQEIVVDAAVHAVRRATGTGPYAGGGGTDMGVGIAQALRLRPPPDAIVVLTDGYTPWPAERPRARVVVVLVGERHADKESVPAWAKAIEVES